MLMGLFTITILKFAYTIAIVFILARFIYFPRNGKKDYVFTFLLLAAIISELCMLVSRMDMSFGFALGIFAIFSLIRYRTFPVTPREMTYIFLSVGIAAKNHLAPEQIEFYKFLVTDGIILLLAGAVEYLLLRDKYTTKVIVYNHLDLIHPNRREELYKDLNIKFGISDIKNVKVGKIDAPKNSARLRITFKDTANANFEDD